MFLPFTCFLYRLKKSHFSVLELELTRAWIPAVPKGVGKHWSLVYSTIRRWWKSSLVGNYVPGGWYGSVAGTLGSRLSVCFQAVWVHILHLFLPWFTVSLQAQMHLSMDWNFLLFFCRLSQAFCYSMLSDTEPYFFYNTQNKMHNTNETLSLKENQNCLSISTD